ncbi:energy transducer TonB, partial [Paracraurococcus ruber]
SSVQAAAAAAAAEAAATPGRATITGPTKGASPLFQPPEPRYPDAARQRGAIGTVRLKLEIDAAGQVTKVEVVTSTGDPALDEAARDYYAQWRWQPALRNGEPVADTKFANITFRLSR